jgi:hypothetical protein
MVKGNLSGLNKKSMKVSSMKIEDMDLVNSNGLMEENMRAIGKTANNMAWEFIEMLKVKNKKENGKKVKE